MQKVILVIKGGVLQQVISDDRNLEYVLIDKDIQEITTYEPDYYIDKITESEIDRINKEA